MASILKNIRGKIMAGFATLVPIAATVWIIKVLFNFFDGFASPFLDKILPFHIPGLGLIVSLGFVFILGIVVTNFLGRKLVYWGERILEKIPVASTIYNTAKQITQAIGGSSSRAFQRTVYIQYPRKGLWTIAFVTGESKDKDGNDYFHLFVPTTPNPTSGVLIILQKQDAIDANISVEQGMKAIISGGMLAPTKTEISATD
ncbi:MAG: DUF502 domain-containing protein [Candidatus Marinimicrobia bacterium]|nr:DUF502 domain-containing protein [Candidatus Neomarinimicrobiota bacterium]